MCESVQQKLGHTNVHIKLNFQFKITVWRYVVMSGHASAFGVINFPPNIQEVRVSIIDVRQGAY